MHDQVDAGRGVLDQGRLLRRARVPGREVLLVYAFRVCAILQRPVHVHVLVQQREDLQVHRLRRHGREGQVRFRSTGAVRQLRRGVQAVNRKETDVNNGWESGVCGPTCNSTSYLDAGMWPMQCVPKTDAGKYCYNPWPYYDPMTASGGRMRSRPITSTRAGSCASPACAAAAARTRCRCRCRIRIAATTR